MGAGEVCHSRRCGYAWPQPGLGSDIANGTSLLGWRSRLQATPMHQPWQQLVVKANIIEFAGREYLANRPLAAAREISVLSSGLHPIANMKRPCHGVCPLLHPAARICTSPG